MPSTPPRGPRPRRHRVPEHLLCGARDSRALPPTEDARSGLIHSRAAAQSPSQEAGGDGGAEEPSPHSPGVSSQGSFPRVPCATAVACRLWHPALSRLHGAPVPLRPRSGPAHAGSPSLGQPSGARPPGGPPCPLDNRKTGRLRCPETSQPSVPVSLPSHGHPAPQPDLANAGPRSAPAKQWAASKPRHVSPQPVLPPPLPGAT